MCLWCTHMYHRSMAHTYRRSSDCDLLSMLLMIWCIHIWVNICRLSKLWGRQCCISYQRDITYLGDDKINTMHCLFSCSIMSTKEKITWPNIKAVIDGCWETIGLQYTAIIYHLGFRKNICQVMLIYSIIEHPVVIAYIIIVITTRIIVILLLCTDIYMAVR